MTRRTYMWRQFYNRFGDLSDEANFESCLAGMLERKAVHLLKPEPQRIRMEFWQSDEHTYARLFSILHEHFAERMGKTRWGEQEGSIEHYSKQIFEAYPSARVIHLIRDPRGRFGDELESLGSGLGRVGFTTAEWLVSTRLGMENVQKYSGRYMLLQFEHLLVKPEETLRTICAFIEEEFSQAMLTLERAISLGFEDDAGTDRTQVWSDERVNEYLSASDVVSSQDVAFIENYAGKLMTSQGYALTNPPLTLSQYLAYYTAWPVNFIRLKSKQPME